MKTAYQRLNRDHRIEIEKLIALGKNKKQIASALSVHPLNKILFKMSNIPKNNEI